VCVCAYVCILLSVVAVTYQSMERGFLNFGNGFSMILEFAVLNVIKISPWVWGLSPYKSYLKDTNIGLQEKCLNCKDKLEQ